MKSSCGSRTALAQCTRHPTTALTTGHGFFREGGYSPKPRSNPAPASHSNCEIHGRGFPFYGHHVLWIRPPLPRFHPCDAAIALRHNDSATTCRVATAPTQYAVLVSIRSSRTFAARYQPRTRALPLRLVRAAYWVGAHAHDGQVGRITIRTTDSIFPYRDTIYLLHFFSAR